MYGEDERTAEEMKADILNLPQLRMTENRGGKNSYRYEFPDGRVVDPQVVKMDQDEMGRECLVKLTKDFPQMRLEDYIPGIVLDGVGGRGGLRSTPVNGIPHWESKAWERKYAIGFMMNGGRHFEVNHAWRSGTDCGAWFNVRRAAELQRDLQAVDNRVAEIDRAEDAVGVGPAASAGDARGKEKRGK